MTKQTNKKNPKGQQFLTLPKIRILDEILKSQELLTGET
jgi:hypothetical protein